MDKEDYQDYLRSSHWHEYRKQQYRRAGYKCENCKATNEPLQVHHLTYERLGCEEKGDTVVLCQGCHREAHGKSRIMSWEEIRAWLRNW